MDEQRHTQTSAALMREKERDRQRDRLRGTLREEGSGKGGRDSGGTLRRWCKERETDPGRDAGWTLPLPGSGWQGSACVAGTGGGAGPAGGPCVLGKGRCPPPPPILKAEGWGGSVRVHREGRGLDLARLPAGSHAESVLAASLGRARPVGLAAGAGRWSSGGTPADRQPRAAPAPGLSLGATQVKSVCGKGAQKPTAPGIPRRSPIQVLTRPDPA